MSEPTRMNTTTRRRVRWYAPLALATAAALLLAACSDDGENDTAEEMTTPTTPAATAEMSATPADSMTSTPETPMATATEAAGEIGAAGEMGPATIEVATEGELAPYLVDAEGMTLYLFTNDEPGVSNCTDGCLANWPPLLVEDGVTPTGGEGVTGELGTIEREDGEGTQVTYDGMPLYYWQGDSAPGDTTGHEVGGVWFVVPPSDDMSMGSSSSSTTNPDSVGY